MTEFFRRASEGPRDLHTSETYRSLTGLCGVVYLAWWGMVELTLPGAFNPFGSRLAVVLVCWAVYGACWRSKWMFRNMRRWLSACLWLITLHYYYLFHFNQTDINWVVGSYITVITACACFHTTASLLSYSAWVLTLSLALCFRDRALLNTVFLPGVFTVLGFAYVGLRWRLRLVARTAETSLRLQNLFDAAFEGIVVHDRGLILDANRSFAEIFGYTAEEVIGRRVGEFVVAEDREAVLSRIGVMSEEPYEVLGVRRDGSRVYIEIRGKKHLEAGRVLRLAAVSDITARKRNERDRVLYEASQRAIRMRDEFLSVASHELKTPLTNIKLQTQMAVRSLKKGDLSVLEPGRMRKFIEQTDRQADKLTRLVEEMLDVARISSGLLKIHWEEFDLSELVREVASTFDAVFRQVRSSLSIETAGPAMIRADRFRVEQVISNLLSNAAKYGNGKPVVIRVESRPQEIRLVVEDHGLGIPRENQERIFQRFERAISSERISGLGLGLYISKKIVEVHGGRIELLSREAHGSRFSVVLPIHHPEGATS